MWDFRHGEFNIKVSFTFNQIITSWGSATGTLSSGIESWEVMSDWEDFINPSFQNVTNTSYTAFWFFNLRIINNTFFSLKLKFNFKKLSLIVLFGVDLIVKMIKSKNNTITNTVSDNCINVFSVFFPLWLLFIKLNSVINFFQKFVNYNTAIFNVDKLVCNNSFEDVIIFFRWNRLVLSFNHWFSEFS